MNIITSENLEAMKARLFEIEEKVSKGQSSNEEVEFAIEVLENTIDYSDLLKIPSDKEHEFQAKTDFQAIGSAIDELQETTSMKVKPLLAKHDDFHRISRLHLRTGKKGMNIRLLAAKRKPFKKELDSFFELLDKNTKLTEAYRKKWCQ
nr:hypothetical protein [Sunxiuqinia sp.]